MVDYRTWSVEQAVGALPARRNQKLPTELREQVLSAIERQPPENAFSGAFVREAMRWGPDVDDEPGRAKRWEETIVALSKAGRQYSVGDVDFRAAMKLFQTPWLLAACQAGAVAGNAPVVVAAALAQDGSEASYDALLAELERAKASEDDWALKYKLKRLAKYAKQNEAWAAFLAAVKAELDARDQSMVATSVAKALGLNVALLQFSYDLPGFVRPEGPVTWYLSISDRRDEPVHSQVVPLRELKGPKKVLELPKWLQTVTEARRITWRWGEARVRSNLRGQYLDAFTAWLRGERASPTPDAKPRKPRARRA